MVEQSTVLGHCIQFQDADLLVMKSGCMECIVREAVKTDLHANNMNWEEGFSLNKSLKSLLQTLKEQKNAPFSMEK